MLPTGIFTGRSRSHGGWSCGNVDLVGGMIPRKDRSQGMADPMGRLIPWESWSHSSEPNSNGIGGFRLSPHVWPHSPSFLMSERVAKMWVMRRVEWVGSKNVSNVWGYWYYSMPPDDSTFLQQKTAVAGFSGVQGGPKGDNNLGYIQDYTLIP